MPNIQKLRSMLMSNNIYGYIIPSTDEFQNEYPPKYLRRLEAVTGFTGSFGIAIITLDAVFFYTDGRYLLQAKQQLSSEFNILDIAEEGNCAFLGHNTANKFIGYDPNIHTFNEIQYWKSLGQKYGFSMIAIENNLVDNIGISYTKTDQVQCFEALWLNAENQELIFKKKLDHCFKGLDGNVTHLLLTSPASIGWLLDVRGRQTPYDMFILAYAIISKSGSITLFYDGSIEAPSFIEVAPIQSIIRYIMHFIAEGATIQCDPANASEKLASYCQVYGPDPCVMLRACKTEDERNGMINACYVDSKILTKFLNQLKLEYRMHTEISASEKLFAMRSEESSFVANSFDYISAFGPNAAIIHYKPIEETNLSLAMGGLYLIDSGGHYKFGTTDITRTILLGNNASYPQKLHYTLVLKGHIALATIVFPIGTCGVHIDAFARQYLWQHGLDYRHGTGHGVGYMLSVHEGPQSISRSLSNKTQLMQGMIVSNEPGYYKENEYGIRLENLMMVVPSKHKAFLCFKLLTYVPFDHDLILPELLTKAEQIWLDDYHANCLSN